MSMRFALLELNPRMRAQAEERLAALPKRTVYPIGEKKPICTPAMPVTLRSRTKGDTPAGRVKGERPSAIDVLLWRLRHVSRLPTPTTEHLFHPVRKWRFDIAWPDVRLAIEIDGVTHDGGRHQRIKGFTEDLKKHNAAVGLNWRVLYLTPEMARAPASLKLIEGVYG
jgi:very-short-patch-repair endonuclease